jgi:amidohydrolase
MITTSLPARLAALASLAFLVAAPAEGARVRPVASTEVAAAAASVAPQVVAWRRDIHQHPELGNRETRTAALVAAHLRSLGMEVREQVAVTGVVGVLRGGRPGPVVALRADMDGLPVLEATGLPFASTARGEYEGRDVPIAHACGHDSHVAMLMGAAKVLADMRERIPGTIVFIFQPAEEGAPAGERGGASLMVEEGVLANPAPSAIFGLHSVPGTPGTIFYRPEGFMAASDRFDIAITGRQTHGAMPWGGIDIISLQAAIVQDFNRLAARTVDVTATPTVITVGQVQAGVRNNIVPQSLTMSGTLRTFAPAQRAQLRSSIEQTVASLSQAYGATSTVTWGTGNPVTFNEPALARTALSWLEEAAGPGKVDINARAVTGAEDFAWYQLQIPGVFVHLGASPEGRSVAQTPPNHSPQFDVNEAILPLGVRAHVMFALRYLESGGYQAPVVRRER